MTKSKITLLAAACLAAFALAGCVAFPFAVGSQGRAKGVPAYGNGQVVDVVGRVVVDKNQVSLQDQNSPALFRFVGLQPALKKALSDLDGKVTRVRLRIVGEGHNNIYNAQLVQLSARP